ncbi:tyrosine-type recombinase/integrase [Methylobacterium indicum]|uniref:Integrase n=1 Tax=Methylobacterium indicum TaxID=1775910 RepID=A0ABR5HIK0_9HYPH|nr:tyrosine-type recombinase/integrase [Methylobacterium indicum]KMO22831.1 integrase [Methylobacterium indicum]KMO26509.1 integrase [Methylobacterium indicum]
MELDTPEPATEPSRDEPALPIPVAEAPPLADILVERLDEHARAARGAFADNTMRAFAADSRIFAAWCREAGRAMLPATPETIAAFIDAQAETKSRATVERYRSSIAALHRAAGLPNPCADEIVRLAVKRMNRAKGRRQKQAEPLNRTSIDRMLTVMTPDRLHRRVSEGEHGAPLIALRNAALVAVAYDTLLRRSELVSLYIGDLERGSDGSGTILVRRSKADQEGEGTIKYLAPDTMAHIVTWLAAARLESGPLFRPLTKGGKVGASALGDREVARVFQALAAAAGLKLSRLPSGHSTRVGATQDMFAAGFELLEVMQAGSWKTPAMPARYGERLRAQRGAARKLATLQNRA